MTLAIPPYWYAANGTWGWYTPDTGFLPLKSLFRASLIGFEEEYTVGVFTTVWGARSAAAKAALGYRKWCREHMDDVLSMPRGVDLKPRVTTHSVDTYEGPWWEKP